jgi:hypothetical protein
LDFEKRKKNTEMQENIKSFLFLFARKNRVRSFVFVPLLLLLLLTTTFAMSPFAHAASSVNMYVYSDLRVESISIQGMHADGTPFPPGNCGIVGAYNVIPNLAPNQTLVITQYADLACGGMPVATAHIDTGNQGVNVTLPTN